MKKVRILALAVVAALLLIFPAIVMGQPLQDHQTRLMVMVDGEKAPDDTKVTAMIGDADVGSAMTMDGIAFLKCPRNVLHRRHEDQFHGRRPDGHGDRYLGAGRTPGQELRA